MTATVCDGSGWVGYEAPCWGCAQCEPETKTITRGVIRNIISDQLGPPKSEPAGDGGCEKCGRGFMQGHVPGCSGFKVSDRFRKVDTVAEMRFEWMAPSPVDLLAFWHQKIQEEEIERMGVPAHLLAPPVEVKDDDD